MPVSTFSPEEHRYTMGGGGVVIFQTVFPKPQPDRIFCFNPSAWACPMQGPKGSLGLPRTLWGLGRDGAHHS